MENLKRTVTITAEDIATGRPNHCSKCPGAKAVLRAFPEAEIVSVYHTGIEVALAKKVVERGDLFYDYFQCRMPKVLGEFVISFDKGETVQPLSFEVELTHER